MTALSDELNNDPTSIGYAPLIADSNVAGLMTRINAPDTATITRTVISRDEFLMAIIPGMDNLLGADSAVQGKYGAMLDLVKAADAVRLTPVVTAMINGLVTDGVMTDVSAILTRPGSRAEAVLGEGTYVSAVEIGTALWGDQR